MSFIGSVVAGATGFLRIDASGVEAGVNRAGNALDSLTNISKSSYFGLRNIGVAFEAMGAAAVAGIGMATKASVDWEQSLAGVERTNAEVVDGVIQNREELALLENQLQALVELQPTGPSVIGKIAEEAGALGIPTENVAQFTDTVSRLINVSDLSQDAATTGLARIAALTGLTADQYDNLGSTIVETGRKTQATETQIVDIASRFTGIGASFGLTASEIIGVSAALASVNLTGRIGVTALQQTFQQFSAAVDEGGATVASFAKTSGVSVQEFSRLFREDAYGALQLYISGLGNAVNSGQDITRTFKEQGIENSQQIRVLRQLAIAQSQAGNDAQSLSGSVNTANKSFAEGNALQNLSQRYYNTTSNQLKILHNDVTIAALAFGSLFLPVLKFVSQTLANVALGFAALPFGARATIAVLAGLAAIIGTVGGGILLLLPRFLIARDTLIQMAAASQAAATGQAEVAATTTAASGPMATLVGLMMELVATQLVLIGEYATMAEATAAISAGQAGYAASTAVATVANVAEAGSMGLLAAAATLLQAALGPIGLITIGITVAVTGLVYLLGRLGQAHRDGAKDALTNATADQQLTDALKKEAEGVKGATASWIVHKLATSGALENLQKLGVSTNDIVKLVTGDLDPKMINSIASSIENAGNLTVNEKKKILDSLQDIIATYRVTVGAESALSKARKEGGIAADDEANATEGAGNAALTAAQKSEKAAQASINYASAVIAEKQAKLSTKDATVELAHAQDDLAHKTDLLAIAQDNVATSQANEVVAADRAVIAKRNLDRARSDSQKKLDEEVANERAAERASQSAVIDLTKAQVAYNKAMDPVDGVLKMRKAVEDLNSANLGLIDSQVAVSDAQWYVNYLMGEGASARDISDANRNLQQQQEKREEAITKVGTAQRDLTDLQGAAGRIALDQAAAEINLANATAAVEGAQRTLNEQQQKVIDLREDIKNDVPYHEALLNEVQAQAGVRTAHEETRKALQNLHDIQGGSIEAAFQRAQLGVESALISQAKATTDLSQIHDEMQGKFWTTQEYAKNFGIELVNVSKTAAGPVKNDLATLGTQVQIQAGQFDNLQDKVKKYNDGLGKIGPNIDAAGKAIANSKADIDDAASFWGRLTGSLRELTDFSGNQSNLEKLEKLGNLLNPITATGAIVGRILPGHASGGLFTQPHIAAVAEDGPELILPLTDLARTQDLLESSGLLQSLGAALTPVSLPASAGGTGGATHIDQSKTVHQGAFAPTVVVQKDPKDIVDDYFWQQRVLSRSA